MPDFTTPIHEFNACHEPAGSTTGGRFCGDVQTMRVGITSARPGKGATEVYAQMGGFERDLKQIKGVSNVSVQPGTGAWQGGSEPSWVVSYVGNGEARRLLAKTASQYDQDAVLLMGRCVGPKTACDPVVDLRFDNTLSVGQIEKINTVLGTAGFSGWTWGKVGGKPVLRMVSVPAWGGNTAQHVKATNKLAASLQQRGYTNKTRIKWVKTEVLDRENYATVLGN